MTSIEFRSVCSFSSPLSTQRSRCPGQVQCGLAVDFCYFCLGRRSSAGATASGCSCCLVVAQRGLLFAGLSDGKILAWEIDRLSEWIRKNTAPFVMRPSTSRGNCADRRAKESKARVLEEHKGDVRCLLYVESLCQAEISYQLSNQCTH